MGMGFEIDRNHTILTNAGKRSLEELYPSIRLTSISWDYFRQWWHPEEGVVRGYAPTPHCLVNPLIFVFVITDTVNVYALSYLYNFGYAIDFRRRVEYIVHEAHIIIIFLVSSTRLREYLIIVHISTRETV